VSRAVLLEINGGVAYKEITEITIVQISSLAAHLMTYSRNKTAELTLISSEISKVLNRKKSLRKISRLFGKERY
jgi:hypothetical protein